MIQKKEFCFEVEGFTGETVSGMLTLPEGALCVYVMAHGAGAGMRHPFMEGMSSALATVGLATLRYQFPYMEKKRRRPDQPRVLVATVRSACRQAKLKAGDLPLLAGGKSMGGRMTSLAMAQEPLACVDGLIFLGFPLHGPGRTGIERADHLENVSAPMLFLQGDRDRLANLDLMRPVCDGLGSRVVLDVIEGADHSFKMLKSARLEQNQVYSYLAGRIRDWIGAEFSI